VSHDGVEGVFISTRLLGDRFALAFEFFINVGHAFVDILGVPEAFEQLAWTQALADVRGETSQDAWESRRRALDRNSDRSAGRSATPAAERAARKRDHSAIREASAAPAPEPVIDEKAKTNYFESAFSDAIAIYLLSLTIDFDYADLREREYPLIAAPALSDLGERRERWRSRQRHAESVVEHRHRHGICAAGIREAGHED